MAYTRGTGMRKLQDESIISHKRMTEMLEDGHWIYDPEENRLTNIATGEIMNTLEWLIKELGAKDMNPPANIKISTTTCPKCEYRPIPTVEGKPTICPVCSNVIGGKHGK